MFTYQEAWGKCLTRLQLWLQMRGSRHTEGPLVNHVQSPRCCGLCKGHATPNHCKETWCCGMTCSFYEKTPVLTCYAGLNMRGLKVTEKSESLFFPSLVSFSGTFYCWQRVTMTSMVSSRGVGIQLSICGLMIVKVLSPSGSIDCWTRSEQKKWVLCWDPNFSSPLLWRPWQQPDHRTTIVYGAN